MIKLVFTSIEREPIEITESRVTIGRDDSNDIVLDNEGVSSFHAEILYDKDKERYSLRDLDSTNGSFVNGKRVSQIQTFKSWDNLRLDEIDIEVQDPKGRKPTLVRSAVVPPGPAAVPPSPPAANPEAEQVAEKAVILGQQLGAAEQKKSASMQERGKTNVVTMPKASLVGKSAPVKEVTFKLKKSPMVLGRSKKDDIVIEEKTISSGHLTLVEREGDWYVEDNNSTNGTYLNGKKIVSSAKLERGCSLQVGEKVTFGFEPARVGREATEVVEVLGGAEDAVSDVAVQRTNPLSGLKALLQQSSDMVYIALGAVVAVLLVIIIYFAKQGSSQQAVIDEPLTLNKLWSYTLPSTGSPATPAIADMNGDGNNNVVLADTKGSVTNINANLTQLQFEVELSGRFYAPPVLGDLTGTGLVAAVVGSDRGVVTAINHSGNIIWQSQPNLSLGAVLNRPALLDINADSIVDVLVPTSKQGLVALDGPSGRLLWTTESLSKGRIVGRPLLYDLDNNGVEDIVILSDTGQLLALTLVDGRPMKLWQINVGAVQFSSPVLLQTREWPAVVVANAEGRVAAINGRGGFEMWTTYLSAGVNATPLVGDFSGDGMDDVFVVDETGEASALSSADGQPLWRLEFNTDLTASPMPLDIDYDGLTDIGLLDESGSLLLVLGAEPKKIHKRLFIPDAEGFIASPLLADVNGDSLLDIVTASTNGLVTVYGLNRSCEQNCIVWGSFAP